MRVNSQDVISKETQSSSRNVLAVSSSVLVVQYFNYNSKDWDILGRTIAPAEFATIALIALAFLLANHLVKWTSDFYLYRKWFSLNEVPAGGVEQVGRIGSTLGPINGLSQRLKWLITHLDIFVEQAGSFLEKSTTISEVERADITAAKKGIEELLTSNQRVEKDLAEANKLLSQLDKRFDLVHFVVKFIVFGWYLALPVLVGGCAVVSLLLAEKQS